MNRFDSDHQLSLTEAIDKLVDGELDPADRKGLMKRLEDEPDAWKRCALAFLEDQAWRESLKTMAAERPQLQPIATTVSRPSDRTKGKLRLDRLKLAAAILAGLMIGWGAKGERPSPTSPIPTNPPLIANKAPELKPVEITGSTENQVPLDAPVRVSATNFVHDSSVPLDRSAEELTFTQAQSQTQTLAQIERMQALKRAGYQFERRERVLALDTKDGGQVAVPVAEYRVQYVGDVTY